MKIKKHSESMMQGLKSIAQKDNFVVSTFLSLDIEGNLTVEKFGKLLDYDSDEISLSAGRKTVYIHGENLIIRSCTKDVICISGNVFKLEIFEVK